ncbi:MAG: glycosyl transferase [Syntrophobacter sp. DG_60]|nr:MAG: glycosyl transferase [Syntrophobacter sp. DG_60]
MIHIEENPHDIKQAEVVVGIPSYNEADSIAFPTKIAAQGLRLYFSQFKCVIINCDNHSTDGTKEVFLNTPTDVPKIYISTPPGIRGKGNNLRSLFYKVSQLGAKAVIVVDADLKSITPKWIKNLAEPVFNNFDFVSPLYVRHKYDGTITNSIAYPLIRALYGRRIRQPIGGDFAFSDEMAKNYADGRYWEEMVAQFGIDIWMTTLAINKGLPICQSFMGRPKIHRAKDPAKMLGAMFYQVIGTIFDLMSPFSKHWKEVKWSKPTAIYGFGFGETELPPPVDIDQKALYSRFLKGFEEYIAIWERILDKANLHKLKEIKTFSFEKFDFPTEMWAKTLYDFAIAYKNQVVNKEMLLKALTPLYFGKVLSYTKKVERFSIQEAEEFIENECMIFEKAKPYLIEKW